MRGIGTVRIAAAAGLVLVAVTACQSGMSAGPAPSRPAAGPDASSTLLIPQPTLPALPDLSRNPPLTSAVIAAPATKPAITAPKATPPVTQAPVPAGARTPVPRSQMTWTGLKSPPLMVSQSGVDVVFVAGQAGCQQVTAHAQTQSPTSVTINVISTVVSHGTQMCPMYVRELPLVVQLTQPLGQRALRFVGVTKHQ